MKSVIFFSQLTAQVRFKVLCW